VDVLADGVSIAYLLVVVLVVWTGLGASFLS
jgi:hypothetical protein